MTISNTRKGIVAARAMRSVVGILVLASLPACTEEISMQNPATGRLATCGDHPMVFPIYATIASTHDKDCVQDFKEQGYVRIPKPG